MKALVTGGAGLIGSHLADLLLQQGHQVRIIDNLSKPTHLHGSPAWIPAGAEFIQGDVRDRSSLDRALDGAGWVFHQAADGGFTPAISHYFSNNALPTALLYELIHNNHPVSKVVVASSQAVYAEGQYRCSRHGLQYPPPRALSQLQKAAWELHCPRCDRLLAPLPRDERHPGPRLPYGLSKYWSEMLALNLGRLYGIPTVALRYALTYGPRQSLSNPYTGICSIFSTRILNGKPPLIYEDGRQTRDFTYVADVARANLLAAENEAANYQVFNVGTGVATSVFDFATLLGRVYGREIQPLLRGEFRPGEARHLVSDAARLRSLGWTPQVSLEEGLGHYSAWIQSHGSLPEYFSAAEAGLRAAGVVLPGS